jgi:hypothetical protein
MHLTRIVWLLALLACSYAGCAAAAGNVSDAGWRLVSERNGIKVYRQDDEGARIKTFRGVTRFPIENPAALEALLNDYAAIPRWMHFISSGEETARVSYLDRTLRFKTELPWPLSDRDVVVRLTVLQNGNDVVIQAVDQPSAAKDPDYVRIPDLNGGLSFRFFPATKETEVTYELVLDPGGNIPAWAANIVLKDTPYFTLLKLRRLIQEPKYQQFQGRVFTYPW